MKIGIHQNKDSFCPRWIAYCEEKQIAWKPVDCYQSDIIQQLKDCDALMWHFHHTNPKDILFAKQLLFSVQAAGKKTFPNFNTCWHFDDKLGQKYLLEAVDVPIVPTWMFYDKREAISWAKKTEFPKVFKLRGGAGSQNVRLVRTRNKAFKLINKAFGRGFRPYYALGSIVERWRLYRLGRTNFRDLLEGVVRFIVPPPYARVRGRENGYILFQKYISNNDHDIRVVVIGNKAFAIKRMVRDNDFRASGSGKILYDQILFDDSIIELSFNLAEKLKCQCIAFDYVKDNGFPLVTEISYGFSPAGYDPCPGFWDNDLNWYNGKFNPYGWIVDDLISSIEADYPREV
jgi:glutathione synthase/RimK-type ligase-like ATP-grasp enzyme